METVGLRERMQEEEKICACEAKMHYKINESCYTKMHYKDLRVCIHLAKLRKLPI
ncbi:hypothetical protein KFK09_016119 [Dendrobium nobile]|uniref:Uncharacterized protein n=1 Tax=Dendrobium nobile TaxID=94219 RepID=A0A8T3AX60_DENNO|nr:hypothetical protein KFK09_016119 [Dendrobium nobile]